MKKLLLLCLCINLYAEVIKLSKIEAQNIIAQRMKFFKEVFLVQYDKTRIEKDLTRNLDFIDLCKYPTSGYKFACGEINGEEVGIKKYFIKDKNIEQAYKIFENDSLKFPKETNFYDYGEAHSNKDDGVGSYYVWDDEGRLWVINMGYDSGSIEIYIQTDKYTEVIYQWSIDE